MGPTRTRYAYGSACAYRMTTACSGAIEESVAGTSGQACSNLGRAGCRRGRCVSRRHPAAPPLFGDSPQARGMR